MFSEFFLGCVLYGVSTVYIIQLKNILTWTFSEPVINSRASYRRDIFNLQRSFKNSFRSLEVTYLSNMFRFPYITRDTLSLF